MRTRNLDQPDWAEFVLPRISRTLRGHERVHFPDSMWSGDVQPQLFLKLLGRLPDHPLWQLLWNWSFLADTVLSWHMAESDGAVQLY